MHRVVVLALDGVFPFELGMPDRVFGTADGRYEVLTCSVDGGPVATSADFGLAVRHGPEVLATADTVVVAAYSFSRLSPRLTPAAVAAFGQIRPGTRLMSICSGAFALAAAGRLDG